MKTIKTVLLTLLLLLIPITAAYGDDGAGYPKPTDYKYVNDYAGIVNSDTRDKIISIGDELYNKTKAEIVVVTIDKLPDNADIKAYANGLFREWGIGSRELNNGVLLLVSLNDREMWIEVGYGLEGAIPDSVAGSIRDEYIFPHFKSEDYNSGILSGYYQLCGRAAREYNVELEGKSINIDIPDQGTSSQRKFNLPIIIAVIVLLAFDGIFLRFRILRFLFLIMASGRGRGGRGGFGGGGGFHGGGGFGGGSSGGGGAGGKW